MKKFIGVIAAFFYVSQGYAFFGDLIESESGDYCKDQAIYSLHYLFGEDLEIKKIKKDKSHKTNGNGGEIWLWATTNQCDGYFVATYWNAHSRNCKDAHYIYVPKYIRRVFATGQCKQVLPEAFYPSSDVVNGNF